jgi:hypothetical protein
VTVVAKLVDTVRELLGETARLELLDRVYVLAAGCFVSVLPILLLATGAFGDTDDQASLVADQIVGRLHLDRAAADAVRTLLPRGRSGLYVVGLAITLFGLVSLSRRAARAYAAIWRIPNLPRREVWRGLVWLLLELTAIGSVAALRDQARVRPGLVASGLFAIAVAVWFVAEAIAQRVITRGQVGWGPLALAAGLVATGRFLVAVWSAIYLSSSLTRQAELYGPVGVVFALFTSLLAAIATTLFATLIASVLTRPGRTGQT